MFVFTRQIVAVLAMLVVTFVWGLTFILIKWTVAEMDVCFFLFLRFFIAFLVLAFVSGKKLLKVDLKTVKSSSILGFLVAVAYIAQTEGLRFTTAANSGMITGSYLVMLPIFYAVFFKAKIRLPAILGVTVSVIGLYLLTNYSFTGINYGDWLTLICAFGWAWHIILNGFFTMKHDTVPLVTYQFLVVTVIVGAVAIVRGRYTFDLSTIAWVTIVVTGVFASAIALVVQTWAQKIINPTRTGIIFALEAPIAAFFGWLLGGEVFTTLAFFGACLMFFGMLVSEAPPLIAYCFDRYICPRR